MLSSREHAALFNTLHTHQNPTNRTRVGERADWTSARRRLVARRGCASSPRWAERGHAKLFSSREEEPTRGVDELLTSFLSQIRRAPLYYIRARQNIEGSPGIRGIIQAPRNLQSDDDLRNLSIPDVKTTGRANAVTVTRRRAAEDILLIEEIPRNYFTFDERECRRWSYYGFSIPLYIYMCYTIVSAISRVTVE